MNSDNNIYERKNYLLKIPYIFSNYIREYDISKANINILLSQGVITEQEYYYYKNLPRSDRQYQIGILQKDKKINEALNNGLIKYRKLFLETNNININDILSIKNDAIFIINKIPYVTIFDNIEFLLKNTYTSYMYLNNKIEIYYYMDRITKKEIIDIKGIGNKNINLHKEYMIDFISYVFYTIQTSGIEDTLNVLKNFYNKYINKELDIGYYREFNSDSSYLINTKYKSFYATNLNNTQYNKDVLNISYNMKLLIEIYKYVSSIYFSNNK